MPVDARRSPFELRTLLHSLTVAAIFPVLLAAPGRIRAQQAETKPALQAAKGVWRPVSNDVLESLTAAGKKVSWPGGTAGVVVERVSGQALFIVPDQGVWTSANGGRSFTRLKDETISGRCETGFALNADPAGSRFACFMLDGKSGLTLDSGKTWTPFQQHGRGWDYGAVDWSQEKPRTLLAVHHESGGELHLSADGGQSWKLLGKDYTAVGIFNATALVASQGSGILRSMDGGATWTKVSDRTPTGRVLCVFKGVGYWISREGLLVSRDNGATWQAQGSALESAWGPFFGKDENQIVVVGRAGKESGFWRSDDAGKTWKFAAPFPEFTKEALPDWTPSKQWAAGWFANFGWDPKRNRFYASRMGHPTFVFEQ